MEIQNKRLYRSRTNKIFAGVLGGLGEYFEIDPVLLRVVYIFISVFTAVFPGIVAYFFMVLVVPKNPNSTKEGADIK